MKRLLLWLTGIFFLKILVLSAVTALVKWLIPTVGDEESDEIVLTASGQGADFKSEATSFRGGAAISMMGGMRLDLRGAELHPEGARLAIRSVMGGQQIIVPSEWPVRIESRALMGGVQSEIAETSEFSEQPALVIEVQAVLGGVQVTDSPDMFDFDRVVQERPSPFVAADDPV